MSPTNDQFFLHDGTESSLAKAHAVAEPRCQDLPRKKPRLTIDPMQSQRQRAYSTPSVMSSTGPGWRAALDRTTDSCNRFEDSAHFSEEDPTLRLNTMHPSWPGTTANITCEPRGHCRNNTDEHISDLLTAPRSSLSDNTPYSNSPEEFLWNNFTTLGPASNHPSDVLDPSAFLPGFIKPLPLLNPETMDCLYGNGVFSLPDPALQNSLLQAFVECVLPSMPIVEWQDILNAINDRTGGHGSVSLLLYHAILFSATTFVDAFHLHEAGFSSRHEAHENFFQKTRLLYQSNVERDPLALVQALLLMTHRLDTADGDDSRHLISIAISTGHSFGLFQTTPDTMGLPYCPKLWKKIAWTCYTTDCQIALRLRRRPIIQDVDFCHPMLSQNDFDHWILSPENRILQPRCTLAWNIQVQRSLCDMCIANTRLCVCIRDVLNVQAKDTITPSATPTSPTSDTSDDPAYTARAHRSETKLAEWANSLPPSCHCHPADPSSIDEDPIIFTQRRLLHMKFYTTIAVFHQSHPFPWSNFCIQHAAHQITRTASDLYQRKLHHRLPLVGVTAILIALVIHVSQMKDLHVERREQATENFQYALAIMASLRELYREASSVTAWALKIMENVVFNDGSEEKRQHS